MTITLPTLSDIRSRHAALADRIVHTPTIDIVSDRLSGAVGCEGVLKLELFQHTGTFKARGALSVIDSLDDSERAKGITAVSAGNHAIAAAWAARRAGVSAKVVMISTANALRRAKAQAEGADLIIKDTPADAFAEVERLERDEGRTFVHPFEGINTSLGAAGVGLELMEDRPGLDAVVVSVGGGGLISGVAAAVKRVNPDCRVYGVEPIGAPNMSRSRAAGTAIKLDGVNTVADSLAPPYSLPFSFALNQAFVDDVVTVDDDAICAGVALLAEEAKLAVEPAAGAVIAGAMGPLKERLAGKRVGFVICGANIDGAGHAACVARGLAALG